MGDERQDDVKKEDEVTTNANQSAKQPTEADDGDMKDEPSGSRWTSRARGNHSVIRDSSAGDEEIGYVTGDEIAGYEAYTTGGDFLGKSKRYDDAKGRVVENYKTKRKKL